MGHQTHDSRLPRLPPCVRRRPERARRVPAALVALLLAGVVGSAPAGMAGQTPAPQPIKVIAFGGVSTVPLLIAASQGLFTRHGVDPAVEFTPNSQTLRAGLADGTYDVAHAAVDNAIAMVETAGADVVIVMGHDDSMNELFVQPSIASVVALRGQTVIVDAPNTAYALQARKILLDQGLAPERDYTLATVGGTPLRLKAMLENPAYAASMLNPPFAIQARRQGLKSLGLASQLIGPYQGPGAFVLRSWAQNNRDVLVRYIAAYIEALRWFLDPANRSAAIAFLIKELSLDAAVAEQAYEQALASPGGLAPDAQLSVEGLRNVLKLRAEIERQWSGTPPPPERYYDLTYRAAALARLAGQTR